jgi:hypothetical protein
MPNVVYWHKADMPVVSLNDAFGGKADIGRDRRTIAIL